MISWVFCKFIKYDLSKQFKVLMLFDLIIKWGKELQFQVPGIRL